MYFRPARLRPIATIAALALSTAPVAAQVSDFCVQGDNGVSSLDFDIKPSMVVHDDAVLDATRGDLGLDGEAAEGAFAFSRTIGSILETAGVPSDAAAREAFVQTMLDSFVGHDSRMLNAQAGIFMPFDERPEEQTELSAAQMLDDAGPSAMVPLALFNRFDLAPETWTHCGEHRIVYGLKRPEPDTPGDRFLLIFEAMVPNPSPADGEQGCRRVTEFWAGLGGMAELDQAQALSGFFYDGVTGHADGDLDGPVVNFQNYGGDGNRGQVRANAFMTFNWQLREWLTQLTFDPSGSPLAFVPVTVKDNPLAELYHDDVSALNAGNVPASVNLLHGQFIQALTSGIVPNLIPEGGAKHAGLVNALSDFDLGAAPVDEETVVLNSIALGNHDKFNEFQSTSHPPGDDIPGQPGGSSVTVTALLDSLGGTLGGGFPGQSGAVILNRAGAGTCQGCHRTTVGATMRQDGANVIQWPDVATGGFVHVREADRALSPALEDVFLPFRRYVLGRHLCKDLVPASPPPPSPDIYEGILAERSVEVEAVATSERYLSQVIGAYLGSVGRSMPEAVAGTERIAEMTEPIDSAVGELSEGQRQGLRNTVSQAIDAARTIERQTPGAFVETRRPH